MGKSKRSKSKRETNCCRFDKCMFKHFVDGASARICFNQERMVSTFFRRGRGGEGGQTSFSTKRCVIIHVLNNNNNNNSQFFCSYIWAYVCVFRAIGGEKYHLAHPEKM